MFPRGQETFWKRSMGEWVGLCGGFTFRRSVVVSRRGFIQPFSDLHYRMAYYCTYAINIDFQIAQIEFLLLTVIIWITPLPIGELPSGNFFHLLQMAKEWTASLIRFGSSQKLSNQWAFQSSRLGFCHATDRPSLLQAFSVMIFFFRALFFELHSNQLNAWKRLQMDPEFVLYF